MSLMTNVQYELRSTQSTELANQQSVANVVARLDTWFETMRGLDGFTGPVVHWWQNCLLYTGVGLDWRYEGIIIGYLELYRRTDDEKWLNKACRAGDDLVNGQLLNGNYRASCFELNPYSGGTPHEAACDLALLSLAEMLRAINDPRWHSYLDVAERNIYHYWILKLWDAQARAFRDGLNAPSFVPNKAATLTEALLALARITNNEELAAIYALPTLDAVLAHQVKGGALDGAIYQNSFGPRKVAKFFPYYVARCVAGLLAGYEWSKDLRYLNGARRAMAWVMSWQYPDGSFPQVVYPGGRVNRYPQWIAAVGDILRAAEALQAYGLVFNTESTLAWLLNGQQPSGGFATAYGFASQITQRPPSRTPDFRDLLAVCGWSDKAFRYLANQTRTGSKLLEAKTSTYNAVCETRGFKGNWSENDNEMLLTLEDRAVYCWKKGAQSPIQLSPEALWK